MLNLSSASQCGSLTAVLPRGSSWSNPVWGAFSLKDRKGGCHGEVHVCCCNLQTSAYVDYYVNMCINNLTYVYPCCLCFSS